MTSKCYFNQSGALSSYEDTEDGGLIIHGVIIMAAGEWTDMHGIHTVFTPEVLQRCAGQWADNAVWTRHNGGAPRSVTEKIGAVLAPYYDPTRSAVIADVYLHNKTDTSRGASALVRMDKDSGGIKDVSAETLVELQPDGTVTDITFTGLALVEDGACEVCKLPAFGKPQEADEMTDSSEEIKETEEVKTEGTDEEPKGETTKIEKNDLLEMLAGFVSGLIPDTADIIAEVQASEGEDRIRALGKLEGCMSAWGFTPPKDFAKTLDDRLAEFAKAINEKLDSIKTETATQYEAPTGLKGRMGADKPVQEHPHSYTFTTKNRAFDRTALY